MYVYKYVCKYYVFYEFDVFEFVGLVDLNRFDDIVMRQYVVFHELDMYSDLTV